MQFYRLANTCAGIVLGLVLYPLTTVAGDSWPQFRGPHADGVVTEPSNLPTEWTASENVAWKTEIPGRGWSSPIVWGNRVFLTTVINHGDGEEPKKGLYFGGNRPELPASEHEWVVICLDLNSGDRVWKKQVRKASPKTSIHLKNSYASETPVTDGEHVYVMFGGVGVYCFDINGNEVWMHNLEPRKTRYGWGTAASPVLFGDRLYVVNDNDEESYLMALDKRTGEQVWRTPRDEKSNWSTPYLWQNELRREIVTLGSGKVRSYDLDGNLLWSLRGMSSITIATPYQYNGLLYISSGYVGDSDRPLYAIRPGAEGDISLEGTETANESIVWSQPTAAPYNPTTIAYEGIVSILYDRGLFAAYDAADGSEIYSKVRIPNGGEFTSSPWAYDGKIFCINEDGVTSVIKAGKKFELLGSNPLADDDMAMATPAIAGDRLLIRTATRIYCIQKADRNAQ